MGAFKLYFNKPLKIVIKVLLITVLLITTEMENPSVNLLHT